MLNWFIERKLRSLEDETGVSVDYLRHLARASLGGFFKFVRIGPLANYRKKLPADAYHLARLTATMAEDCGTCVQIGIYFAKKDRIHPDLLRAVVERRWDELPAPLATVVQFSHAIAGLREDAPELREKIRKNYGEAGLAELALAIASCRMFPAVKRALGYAQSCAVHAPVVAS